MNTYKGNIQKNDLEGGFWELVAEDGQRYQLQGGDEKLLQEGQKVEIQGEVQSNSMGIGMVGSILRVSAWSTL